MTDDVSLKCALDTAKATEPLLSPDGGDALVLSTFTVQLFLKDNYTNSDFTLARFQVGGIDMGEGDEGLARLQKFIEAVPCGSILYLEYPGETLHEGSLGWPVSPFTDGPYRQAMLSTINDKGITIVFPSILGKTEPSAEALRKAERARKRL